MQVSLTKLILEKIGELGEIYFDIFFPPQYSYTRISRRLFGLDHYPEVKPRTVSSMLSRLKRQGLIKRKGGRKKSRWSLTKNGVSWLKDSGKKGLFRVPEKDGIPRLVVFDIPERYRKKRNIIREGLTAYNFRQLQKSVWIGYNPLPEDFITLLDDLGLNKKVHILSIREGGTLGNLRI